MNKIKGIKPNMLDSNEMKAIKSQYPSANLDGLTIAPYNAGAFNFIGLKLKKGSGVSMSLQVQQFSKSKSDWENTNEELKKRMWARFQQVVMIHDPNKIESEKQKTKKELLQEQAEDLGINTSGLTIAELEAAIAEAKQEALG